MNLSKKYHYVTRGNCHIAPIEIHCAADGSTSMEYVNYGYTLATRQCSCHLEDHHENIDYIVHGQTSWPNIIRFLSTWRPFCWLYNGTIQTTESVKWNDMVRNAKQCSCCPRGTTATQNSLDVDCSWVATLVVTLCNLRTSKNFRILQVRRQRCWDMLTLDCS